MILAILATALVAASVGVATSASFAGSPAMWLVAGAPYAILGAVALARLVARGELAERLAPRSGDVTLAAIVAALLYAGALVGRTLLAPHASAREGWLVRLYLQLGAPSELRSRAVLLFVAIGLLAALEELTWRELVLRSLQARYGARGAWPAAAVLYAVAHAATLRTLADPFVGPNPLVVLGALGSGLVWGYLVTTTGRLPVAILSHAGFVVVAVAYLPLWQLG